MGSIKMCTGSTKMCLVITRHMAIGQSGKKRKQTVQKGPIADLTSSLRVRSWDLRRVPSNGLVGEGPRSHLLFVGTRSGLAFRGRKRTGASYKRLVLSCWERSETERERERERESRSTQATNLRGLYVPCKCWRNRCWLGRVAVLCVRGDESECRKRARIVRAMGSSNGSLAADMAWVGKRPARRLGGMADVLTMASDLGFHLPVSPGSSLIIVIIIIIIILTACFLILLPLSFFRNCNGDYYPWQLPMHQSI